MVFEGFAVVILIVMTLILPPIGVFMISGCSGDFLVNIILTLLGYFPGHIHAFYCEYIYYDRRARLRTDAPVAYARAPFIFSDRIHNGGAVLSNHVPYPP